MVYESVERKPENCLTWEFLQTLTMHDRDRRKEGSSEQLNECLPTGSIGSTRALSLDQSTDFRYKATILVPNFVKKVGTFFGFGTQLKRMK